MNENKLTKENYHSVEMRKAYMGYSQYKMFLECPVKALAYINGEYEPEKTESLMIGGYFDAYMSDEVSKYEQNTPEMFNSRTGELKAPYKKVTDYVDAVHNDPILNKYWSGEHQVIMVGEIAGVPWKIKIDSYFPTKAIADGKLMKDMEDVWVFENGKNIKKNFIMAYRYDLEGASYQEIEKQNTGGDKKLPFFLDVITKQEVPDKAVIRIDQDILDNALEEIKRNAPIFQSMKMGLIKPTGCGKCPVCLAKKQATVTTYKELFLNDDEEGKENA